MVSARINYKAGFVFYWDILSLLSQMKHSTLFEPAKIKEISKSITIQLRTLPSHLNSECYHWKAYSSLAYIFLIYFTVFPSMYFSVLFKLPHFLFLLSLHSSGLFVFPHIVQSCKGSFLQIFALPLVFSPMVLRDLVITISYCSLPWD